MHQIGVQDDIVSPFSLFGALFKYKIKISPVSCHGLLIQLFSLYMQFQTSSDSFIVLFLTAHSEDLFAASRPRRLYGVADYAVARLLRSGQVFLLLDLFVLFHTEGSYLCFGFVFLCLSFLCMGSVR